MASVEAGSLNGSAAVNSAGESSHFHATVPTAEASSQPKLHVVFNSLSAATINPLYMGDTERGIRARGRGIVKFHRVLRQTFGEENVEPSLLADENLQQLVDYLALFGISPHSYDMRDVKPRAETYRDAKKSVLSGRLGEAAGHLGWGLNSAESEEEQFETTRQGLLIADKRGIPRRVKANASIWRDPDRGNHLIQMLRAIDGEVILAVELDAQGGQSVPQYEEFMNRLIGEYTEEGKLRPRRDVDTGAYAYALENHAEPHHPIQPVTEAIAALLIGPHARETEIFSVNQFEPKSKRYHEAHLNSPTGVVDIPRVAELVGQGMREGVLRRSAVFLLETDPRRKKWHATQEGKEFHGAVLVGFNRGARNVSQEQSPLAAAS